MNTAILLLTCASLTYGQFPNTQYGNPGGGFSLAGQEFSRSPNFGRTFDPSSFNINENTGGYGDDQNTNNQQNPGGKVHKFVSVHIAPPEDPSKKAPTRPQIPQKPETHYQIVFIKAPTPSPQDAQEIQLPPLPETKTLVYVLLKKPSLSDSVKIKPQPTPKPTPPEVFFIRYKGPQGGNPKNKGQDAQDPNQTYVPPSGSFGGQDNEIDGPTGSGDNQYGNSF